MQRGRIAFFALVLILAGIESVGAQQPLLGPPPPEPPPSFEPAPLLGRVVEETEGFIIEEPPSGWFTELELGLAFSRITQFSGFPKACLDATVLPDLHIGYRFAGGNAVQFGWRYLNARGNGSAVDPFLGPVRVHSRVENVVVDLDYVSRRYDSGTGWSLQWLAGLRADDLLIRSRLEQPGFDLFGDNDFGGLGGHLGLGVARVLGASGWVLYARLDGGLILGTGRQRLGASASPFVAGFETSGPETVPMLHLQAGFGWSPPDFPWFRLVTGYQYEQWWLRASGDNSANAFFERLGYLSHGPFLRCEFGY